MAKITLNPISGSYASVPAINARLEQIETALNDNVLWRDGFVSEDNTMNNELDMNGYSIINVGEFSSENLYLGAFSTAPSDFAPGIPLDATHTGVLYFNSTDNSMYVWTGSVWSSLSSAATTAASVSITDTNGSYSGSSVEDALQELGSTAGAGIVKIVDSGGHFTSTTVEDALAELYTSGAQKVSEDLSITTPTTTNFALTLFPSWATKITIQIWDLRWTLGNFVPYLWTNPGWTRASAQSRTTAGTGSYMLQTGNSNKAQLGVAVGGITGWWNGTIVLTKLGTTDHWNIQYDLSENTEQSTGSSPTQHVVGTGFHHGTAPLNSVTFGRNTEIQHGNVIVTYEV